MEVALFAEDEERGRERSVFIVEIEQGRCLFNLLNLIWIDIYERMLTLLL